MTLVPEGVPPEARKPTEEGWRGMFDGLGAVL